jgi:mRNA-degrading endonuclease RelE of RelBE toxin-antitoxin system
MRRRHILQSLAALPVAGLPVAASPGNAIQLHTDLEVPADREAKMLDDFEKRFLSNIDAKLLKFRQANVGKAHERYNYRLIQTFDSEENRVKWTHAEGHKVAWHEALEAYVKTPFIAYLYDIRVEGRPSR